ncbi:MAG: ABC transporter substrate-binding protein [Propionibacterium sp.]|nr:ABC transporter substrate-binding protein [Propionibacterium sp.]
MIGRRELFLAGGAATLLAAGCADPDDPAAPSPTSSPTAGASPNGKVTVGLTYIPNVQFCAFYLGIKEGLFDGVDVEVRHHGEQEDLFGALIRGQEQIVFASADEAVVAGQGLTTVATSYQQYPVEVLFLGEATSLDDLRGKTLGIPGRFGTSYYAALVALDSAGLTEDDVELQDIGFTQVSAMATAKVDAIIGFANNEYVQLQLMDIPVSTVPIADPPVLVGAGLITTQELSQDPATKAVVEGLLAAERRAIEDPQAALVATQEFVPALADPTQMEMAERVLEATSKLWLDDAGEVSVDVDQAAMQRMEAFLTAQGFVA